MRFGISGSWKTAKVTTGPKLMTCCAAWRLSSAPGRPAGPLIETAVLRRWWLKSCDIDAVDWFLDQLVRPVPREPTVISADPWQETGVAQFTQGGGRALAKLSPRASRKSFAEECVNACRGFGQLPGIQLRWGLAGIGRSELRMAGQTMASCRDRR